MGLDSVLALSALLASAGVGMPDSIIELPPDFGMAAPDSTLSDSALAIAHRWDAVRPYWFTGTAVIICLSIIIAVIFRRQIHEIAPMPRWRGW